MTGPSLTLFLLKANDLKARTAECTVKIDIGADRSLMGQLVDIGSGPLPTIKPKPLPKKLTLKIGGRDTKKDGEGMPFEYVTVRQLRESTSFAREPEPICGIFRFPDETPVVMYWERVSVSGGALADDLRRMDKMQNLTVYAVSPSQLQSRKFDLTVPLKFGSLGATIWQQLGGGGSACPVAIPKRVPKTSSFRIAGKDVRRDGTRKPLTWVAREDFLQLAIHPSDHTPATTEAMLAIEQAPKDTCLILFWGA